jgi:hypothetical protein
VRLLAFAHIVKLDVQQISERGLERTYTEMRSRKLTIIAEKVETVEEFERRKALGHRIERIATTLEANDDHQYPVVDSTRLGFGDTSPLLPSGTDALPASRMTIQHSNLRTLEMLRYTAALRFHRCVI